MTHLRRVVDTTGKIDVLGDCRKIFKGDMAV